MKKSLLYSCILLILFGIQINFWLKTYHIKPEMEIVENVPSRIAIKANSLGDEQLYFRFLTLILQNAGDTFGRFTALKLYDYKKLSDWFYLLDILDDKSNFVPSIASYYYSQTQRSSDVKYIINYLDDHASKDLVDKWWWLSQAVYLANFKLKNKILALSLAYKLAKIPANMPMWARQMPAFIHEQLGEKQQAYLVIKDIIDNKNNLTTEEMNFMNYFIKDRLNMLLDK